ncbi:MAG: gamma carbonic anhydrase family protein [Spirochaetota bacterium]|nr:gamma carbonic anhydrase family protein [Spirochaetota bacterium]
MPLFEFKNKRPKIDPDVAYISESAIIIGDVAIGRDSVIFDNVVIEGDVAPVIIGERVNIQSQSVIHTIPDSVTTIGNNVTVGHRAVVHGAVIEDNVTIGIGAIIASYSQVGKGSVIGEGSLVPQKKQIPKRVVAVGSPAKVIGNISDEQEEYAVKIAGFYVHEGQERVKFLKRIDIDKR